MKANLTGHACDRPPATVGERTGSSLQVAGADEWALVIKMRHEGRYLNPAEVLQAGNRLEDGR